MQPLRGVTVVSLEQAIAAPYASRHLADLGARVIKVERPGVGDFARAYDTRVNGLSSHFVWVNRNKESLTLDIKKPRGKEILRQLLADADVFIQNLAPGAAARAGLGAEELRTAHPRLIVCDISGYGTPGPYETMKAYDLLVQSEAGLLSVTGNGEDMAKAGISVSDIAAGMYAYSSILAALLERGRTGKGAHLDVSMLESTVEWMGFPLYYAYDGAPPPVRAGAAHATIYPYGPFEAGDGGVVMMSIQNEREWRSFCEKFLGRPEIAVDPDYATNADRNTNREALGAIVSARFAELTAAEAMDLLAAIPVAHARVNSMAEVWNHPQLAARGRWHEVGTPAGPVPSLSLPGLVTGEPRMDPVPELGSHTRSILAELGLSEADIDGLIEEGAV
ncbi:CaiB/BaiF CoA-transferase family protein [Amycolatopsis sp. YIM 10]|uniref:CaiB/BaiF CoA transferase family protein n=1 Tax=Amycolatopsis sp. YIM 10 TaxID=2653857 RepID=UPI0012906F2A|nr:CaiB/BaiF CoA-transferase family protein [Amycolatopsis sp. YIM 10]QFU86860.1 Formyl-coenzyme A transferase [Amycolatopsis sp. YIM 10]